ncbi:MAG: bifunctional glutamate N-acetyltransferase/amino-acid acetyltransferase ArgJ [Candidatus Tectomicrobia bacterium]|uniref:Arginine biosynthesis bifunctional protein ArgJ n=1 Tax=Tectimicrobiota bacterium TaxID=2528274 RepID=A0A932CNG4_UNCTE|nr:bifunctional glutamate N-acetyltransferase/amino-acid acetyltransferase ArgJ [Candidatus Tectomicrobia bacterium]
MANSLPKLSHYPRGYLTVAKNVGIKDETLDLALIFSEVRANAAAVFTQSRFAGAPVILGRQHIADGYLQALVINSKNANVATGQRGLDISREITQQVAAELGINYRDVLPSSTGIIGRQLPVEKIRRGLQGIRQELKPESLEEVAVAIMTTDRRPKYIAREVDGVVINGIAKGAGMIEPNMATMLAYLLTDARIPSPVLQGMLKRAVDRSFNMISIDTDTSTSDTVVLLANGLAREVDPDRFQAALDEVCLYLAQAIARDGEGASKLIEVTVSGARDFAQARRVAKAVVNSPLVKTAVYGCDPNWGRVCMAVGKCHEEKEIRPERTTIAFGPGVVFREGTPQECDLEELRRYLASEKVCITVDLGIGSGEATVWGCDLTEGYIQENAYYST